jgi:hypothetical protein
MGRINLTIDDGIREADFSRAPEDQARIKKLRDSIHLFRSKIIPARNRLIGHLDLDAVMAGQPLGPASEAEWKQFWDDLEQFLHLVHTRYVDPSGHFVLNDVGMISDPDSLVKALKETSASIASLPTPSALSAGQKPDIDRFPLEPKCAFVMALENI